MSKRDEQRHAFLLAKMSLLKSGISSGELRRYEQDRLLAQSGLPRAPERARTRLDEDAAKEWRKFARGEEVRSTFIPKDSEARAYTGQQAGQQSITYTQGPSGGTFVAPGMSDRLYQTLKQHDAIFDPAFSNVVETETGAVTPFPIFDDVGNNAVQVGETSQSTEVIIANVNSSSLHAWAFRSKIVAISNELATDSNWPVGEILERVFAGRIARGVGAAMVSGTGVNSPTGLIPGALAAGASIVVSAGSATNTGSSDSASTTIGTQDLGKLLAALNPAYRRGACFYMNDATLQYLAQLLDKMGRPIVNFREGLEPGDEDVPVILGHKVAQCPSFPTMGASTNSVVIANPLYVIQRRVPSSIYVRAFREAAGLVENGLVGFEMWCRFDSGFVSGNSSYVAAAILQMHS
jgi:HK97 family phage major capsid protein